LRLGFIRYLNVQPLVYGLGPPQVTPVTDAPSRMLTAVHRGRVDVALLPVADLLAPGPRLALVGNGIIGGQKSSLTVKLFSHAAPHRLTRVMVDLDSHTSVALLRLLCRDVWRCTPTLTPLPADPARWADQPACLVIGDKAVLRSPPGFAHEVDLATVWSRWTGLPFVFAAWAAPACTPPERRARWARLLNAARDQGLNDLASIIRAEARPRGWSDAMARAYFTRHLAYRMTPVHRRGLRLFLRRLHRAGLAKPVRWNQGALTHA
jgi:chorismate dehydratase